MESEDVNEEVQWEARRVVAAFGVQEWHSSPASHWSPEHVEYRGKMKSFDFSCTFDQTGCPVFICIDYFNEAGYMSTRVVKDNQGQWHGTYRPRACELMARGVYCLGIEEEQILAEYGDPYLLSAHEKLELRLSMPREFWPPKWLHEQDE